MNFLWKTIKYMTAFVMVVGLVFSSGVFSVLIYGRLTGKEWAISPYADAAPITYRPAESASPGPSPAPTPAPVKPERKASVLLDAPIYRQHPELPSGCEITSLSMLLNFAGVAKTKMDLLSEMPVDMTPITLKADGSPAYWGNPNTGFVGEVSGKGKG
ncbi:MAG: peptidase C39-like family protein, partial [Paenibacillaceae bacterium]|nr:peptidase C39-like family protein [Paenibacillaceae bacterium]